MVHEDYYEEKLDWNLVDLLPRDLQIEKVKAFRVTRPRIIGDIGIRAFRQLTNKAVEMVKREKFDFLYIPIPSFYAALIGRIVHRRTGIAYGIDYIDPWVHHFPGEEKLFSRPWLSSKIAKILEPIAVKKTSLITGVAEGYYKGVIERNPQLKNTCVFGAMPYGGEQMDYEKVKEFDAQPYLFKPDNRKLQFVYAGAMLPKAYEPLKRIFKAIVKNIRAFENIEFHFIGTGKSPNDPTGYNIKPIAEEFGIWESLVFEYPKRIPYLDVLIHLRNADGIFVLGSTEPHYTPSKIYQGVLSEKFIMAVLHRDSSAVDILKQSAAGIVLEFNGEEELNKIENEFPGIMASYKTLQAKFNPESVNKEIFDQYSAKEVTRQLAGLLNRI